MNKLYLLKLRRLWNKFLKLGYETRKNQRDGLLVWRQTSKTLGYKHSLSFKWSNESAGLLKKIISAGFNQTKYDQEKAHQSWEKVHFIYQIGAIPSNKPPDVTSLMQIAFNYGSALFVAKESEFYNQDALNNIGFLELNNMEYFIELCN